MLSGPAASPSTQQLQVFSGNPAGQTINGAASYASLTCAGTVLTVHVSLTQTNQPNASFQIFYKLDSLAPVATGVLIATDGSGNGTASFNIPEYRGRLAQPDGRDQQHSGPGTTYYIGAGASGIPFAC